MSQDVFSTVSDAGHGARDCGAAYGNLNERDLVLVVAKAYKDTIMSEFDCTSVLTRKDNVTEYPLDKRIRDAENIKADLYLAWHLNSSVKSGADRGEVIKSLDGRGDALAQFLADKASKELNQPYKIITRESTKYPNQDYFGVNRLKSGVGLIIELAFINTPADIKDYDSDEELKAVGVRYARWVAEFYKLKPKKVAVSDSPVELAIKKLNSPKVGVISSPDYWVKVVKGTQPLELDAVKQLILNMANKF